MYDLGVVGSSLPTSAMPLALIGLGLLAASLIAVVLRNKRRYAILYSQMERYRDAVNEHCMVNVTDAAGRITSVNDRFLRITGLTRDAALGNRVDQLAPLTPVPGRTERINAHLSDGKSWSGETAWQQADGKLCWTHSTLVPVVNRRGRLVETFAIRTDITAVKMADAETQLRATLDLLQDEVWMFSPEDLRFIYLNRKAMTRLGWDGQCYEDRTLADVGWLADLRHIGRDLKRLTSGQESALTYEVQDREDRTLEITLQLVAPAGNPARYVAVLRDITERQAAARAKSQFVAMVSHELRTPLTSIKGGLGLLTMTAAAEMSERSRSILTIAQRNTDRLIVLINDILDLEKIDAGMMDFRMEHIDLTGVICEAIEMNGSYGAQFGVQFAGIGLDRPVMVDCSPERLLQVLTNLMSNAAKFSKPGDTVQVGLSDLGSKVRIFVKDYGAGIPLEAQPRILERFTQADSSDRRKVGGSGLGLSIVKAIVERHGAEIRFDSRPGQGSEFYFDLERRSERNVA
ncbi:PAS domain-containing sensor histidine kinase [Frigidibacter albus]|uniref:histidine kinase n=2 Tax=Frigidibacter mobilis TaxID=1335048 RepID=A0A159Z0S0_9RHOB|nr:PAS/PAC sensor hybrid histidine kinase [Frigidibacter mobilis]